MKTSKAQRWSPVRLSVDPTRLHGFLDRGEDVMRVMHKAGGELIPVSHRTPANLHWLFQESFSPSLTISHGNSPPIVPYGASRRYGSSMEYP